ncbi:single-stranded DNA-binding protein [bacterium]|nr:single-stranded DNA-binding protein [bacterium]
MNYIILTGRLTADPILRYTPTGVPVLGFTLAVDRRSRTPEGEREADFIDIVVWRKQAEICANYLRKGRLVGVEGRLEISKFQGSDGQVHRKPRVIAYRVEFLDSRPREGEEAPPEEIHTFDEDAFIDDISQKIDIDLGEDI